MSPPGRLKSSSNRGMFQGAFRGFEGYVNAGVLVEGLKRACPALDRERFIDALKSIREYELGLGNALSFSSTDHQALEKV